MSIKNQNLNSKSEYLNSKQILISQFSKFQTCQFTTLEFRIWDLFRISDFACLPARQGFRIFRFALLFLIFGFWILDFNCYAAPCYGTKVPLKNKFFMGLQTHTLFKRYLEDEFGKVRSTQHFFLLSYGVYDWLSVDLKGGAGNIKQHPIGSDELDYSSSFSGGYGLRVKFLNQDKIKAVLGFQHISMHPKHRNSGAVRNEAILDDWQWSILASYNVKRITPYLGIKWSRIDYIHRVDGNKKRRMSDLTKGIGLVAGFDLPITERFWLNLEGQCLDGEALAVSVNYSF